MKSRAKQSTHPQQLILASSSPRRTALLRQIGLQFNVHPSHIDETIDEEVTPEEHVLILSERKARSVAMHFASGIVLGADTIVVIDREIINKPRSAEEAVRMLKQLSGRRHAVFTGISLVNAGTGAMTQVAEKTAVWFRPLEMDEIKAYVATGSPLDKAGAYGIQDDFGAVFVEKVNGCFYNVVGLPLARFYQMYRSFQGPHAE